MDAIEKALKGDERCTLDSMRLVDLLLVLLFEGRRALGKPGACSSGQLMPRIRRMDSAAEKSHRQLIDCIRSKDTDALIEAIENGGIEVKPRESPQMVHKTIFFFYLRLTLWTT